MHAWSTNMLLLLHSAFMLSMETLSLIGEVGVCALESHGNYIADHGKSWNSVFEFLWEPCYFLVLYFGENFMKSRSKLPKLQMHENFENLFSFTFLCNFSWWAIKATNMLHL